MSHPRFLILALPAALAFAAGAANAAPHGGGGGGGHGGGGGAHAGGAHAGAAHAGTVHAGAVHAGAVPHGGAYHGGAYYGGAYGRGYYPYRGGYGYGGGVYLGLGIGGYPYDYGAAPYAAYPDYYNAPTYAAPPPAAYVPGASYRVVDPPGGGAPADLAAHVEVRAPAGAEVWFGQGKTQQTGPVREFVSPALTPGQEYSYVVKARWMDGDKEVIQTRRIDVSAGDWKTINFNKPAPETVEPPQAKP